MAYVSNRDRGERGCALGVAVACDARAGTGEWDGMGWDGRTGAVDILLVEAGLDDASLLILEQLGAAQVAAGAGPV